MIRQFAKSVTILGAGAWGKALGLSFMRGGYQVCFWNRSEDHERSKHCQPSGVERSEDLKANFFSVQELAIMQEDQENSSWEVKLTYDLQEALRYSPLKVFSFSVQSFPAMISKIQKLDPGFQDNIALIAAKGVVAPKGDFLSDVVQQGLPSWSLGILAGPNLAGEVAKGETYALTLASQSSQILQQSLEWFSPLTKCLLETSGDVLGLQLASALKNPYAIGYGLIQQCTSSHNLWATFLNLVLREMGILIRAFGGDPNTIFSFGALGDLILTSHSPMGRNSSFGRQFPQSSPHLVEGLQTLPAIVVKLQEKGISAPLLCSIHEVLGHRMSLESWMKKIWTLT